MSSKSRPKTDQFPKNHCRVVHSSYFLLRDNKKYCDIVISRSIVQVMQSRMIAVVFYIVILAKILDAQHEYIKTYTLRAPEVVPFS